MSASTRDSIPGRPSQLNVDDYYWQLGYPDDLRVFTPKKPKTPREQYDVVTGLLTNDNCFVSFNGEPACSPADANKKKVLDASLKILSMTQCVEAGLLYKVIFRRELTEKTPLDVRKSILQRVEAQARIVADLIVKLKMPMTLEIEEQIEKYAAELVKLNELKAKYSEYNRQSIVLYDLIRSLRSMPEPPAPSGSDLQEYTPVSRVALFKAKPGSALVSVAEKKQGVVSVKKKTMIDVKSMPTLMERIRKHEAQVLKYEEYKKQIADSEREIAIQKRNVELSQAVMPDIMQLISAHSSQLEERKARLRNFGLFDASPSPKSAIVKVAEKKENLQVQASFGLSKKV